MQPSMLHSGTNRVSTKWHQGPAPCQRCMPCAVCPLSLHARCHSMADCPTCRSWRFLTLIEVVAQRLQHEPDCFVWLGKAYSFIIIIWHCSFRFLESHPYGHLFDLRFKYSLGSGGQFWLLFIGLRLEQRMCSAQEKFLTSNEWQQPNTKGHNCANVWMLTPPFLWLFLVTQIFVP